MRQWRPFTQTTSLRGFAIKENRKGVIIQEGCVLKGGDFLLRFEIFHGLKDSGRSPAERLKMVIQGKKKKPLNDKEGILCSTGYFKYLQEDQKSQRVGMLGMEVDGNVFFSVSLFSL